MNRTGRNRRLVVSWLILSLALGSAAAAPKRSTARSTSRPEPVTLEPSEFVEKAQALLTQRAYQSIQWGVCVVRLDTGETVFGYNADELLIPASNRKLFVSALALHHLGPDYRFRTGLYLSGAPADSQAFAGNLVVRGSGDPTFLNLRFGNSAYSIFRRWAEALKSRGIHAIEGDIVMDSSGFAPATRVAEGWIKDYETAQYAPRASAICYEGNCISIAIRPANTPGNAPIVSTIPDTDFIAIDNHAETGPSRTRDSLAVQRADDGADHLVVSGRIANTAGTQQLRVPVEQPGLIAGEALLAALKRSGIEVRGKVRALTADTAASTTGLVPVAEHVSPPLSEILSVMNKKSDNHIAEQIYQAVTFARTGSTSYLQAKRFEESFLAQVGILPNMANFEDGCGLSRLNLVSPRAVVRLLTFMEKHPHFQTYYDTLPIAGRDGTLRGRLGGAINRIHAKTGALSMASSLSGYAETRSGVRVAFSILVNNCGRRLSSARYVQDRIGEWLVDTRF